MVKKKPLFKSKLFTKTTLRYHLSVLFLDTKRKIISILRDGNEQSFCIKKLMLKLQMAKKDFPNVH